MDLGFEPQIREILELLSKRRRGNRMARRTILCSATMEERVEKLSGFALRRPITFQGQIVAADSTIPATHEQHAPPTQLTQSYVVAPAKLRFVALVALLRQVALAAPPRTLKADQGGNKVLVFMSCTAAVDFHWSALGGLRMGRSAKSGEADERDEDALASRSQLLLNVPVYRLHGNLDLPTRLASLKAFAGASGAAVLLCTSVAARGLDVPFVRCVIQYDLPTEVRRAVRVLADRAGRRRRVHPPRRSYGSRGPSGRGVGVPVADGIGVGALGRESHVRPGVGRAGRAPAGRRRRGPA